MYSEYKIEEKRLSCRPTICVGSDVYEVDNRLSAYERIMAGINKKKTEGGGQMQLILSQLLGKNAYEELLRKDLPYDVMLDICTMAMAALQGISLEEAKVRFRLQK